MRTKEEELSSERQVSSDLDAEKLNLNIQLKNRDDKIAELELKIKQNEDSYLAIAQSQQRDVD